MAKIRLLTRYIASEYFSPLSLGIIIFSFVLLLDKIFDFVDLYFNKGVSFFSIIKLLALICPGILTLTIPMGFLLGALLAFGRLSEDGEITALRSSGQHIVRLFWPPLVLALGASICLWYFNAELIPQSQHSFRQLYREVLKANPLAQLEEKTFLEVSNYKLYVHHIDKKSKLLKGVHIYRLEEQSPPTRIYAREGHAQSFDQSIVLNLENGTIQQIDPANPSLTTVSSFKKYDIQIPLAQNTSSSKNIRSMKTSEILKEITRYRAHQIPTTYLETEFHLRNAIAFAPIAFCLIGMVLGVQLEKGGKSIGFGMSLLILFIYYLLLVGGITLSEKGMLLPWFDLWFCNIITGTIGIIFFINLIRK